MKRSIARLVVLGFALSCIGCATAPRKPIVAPSTAPTQRAINTAKDANTSAQEHNARATTLAERIDAKDRVIDQWHQQHQ